MKNKKLKRRLNNGGYISPTEETSFNIDTTAKEKNTYLTPGQEVGWAALDIIASPVGISGKPLSGYLTNKKSSVTKSKGSTFGTIEAQYMHPVAQEVLKAFPMTKPFAEAGQAIGNMASPMVNADDPNAVATRQMMTGVGGAATQAGMQINDAAQNWGAGKKSFDMGGQLPSDMNMGLNELNGPSHEEGGMSISPQVEVEGDETVFEPESYVFSDSLTIPGKKRTFAQESKSIRKKYSLRPEDKLSQNAMNKELKSLMNSQEEVKQLQMIKDHERFNKRMMLKYGGPLTKSKDKNKDNSSEPLDIKWQGGTEDISDIKPLANIDYKQDEFFKANMNDSESILAHIGSNYPSDNSMEIVNWYNDTYAKPNANKGVRPLWADAFPDGSTTYGYQGIDMNKYRDNPNMAKRYGLMPSKFRNGGPLKNMQDYENSINDVYSEPLINQTQIHLTPEIEKIAPLQPLPNTIQAPSLSGEYNENYMKQLLTGLDGFQKVQNGVQKSVQKSADGGLEGGLDESAINKILNESEEERSDYNNMANNLAMITAGAKGLNKQRLLLTPKAKMNYINSRPAEILAEQQASQGIAAGLDSLRDSGMGAGQMIANAGQLVGNMNKNAAATVTDLRLKRDMGNVDIANNLSLNNQAVSRENNALTTQYDSAQMLRRDKILDDFNRIGQSRVLDDKQKLRENKLIKALGKENFKYDSNGELMVKTNGNKWVYVDELPG